ncbi:nuclear transport factor 2 family protein [Curtobacterium sp. ISL-83]|uniref:nuclear transport factor 2 family protein n=1 Tax=Curtobacterium sp. ISL-83 TaxID=2819145 RepID=UPI001BE5C809|nr:nuclear transport factor 2 family protein [Curtobacterium sp. ISL-83]MBT2502873.1 nuclear transport factor 2 family protein [Curtobacterium sp. ISL-83]
MPELSPEQQVAGAEDALVQAMRSADLITLERLTADDVVFTNAAGQSIGKAEDLDAYRAGRIHLDDVTVLDRQVAAHDGVGQTRMLASVTVTDGHDQSRITLSWERRWEERGGLWILVAADTALTR